MTDFDASLRGRARAEERAFVATLGGYALEIAGAHLVTHERIPVPRFNFVQGVRVAPSRQSAFFERALDHYFQRAIRPTFRVAVPVPAHLDSGLRSFGFVPRADLHALLLARARPRERPSGPARARVARDEDLDTVLAFWIPERDREELKRSVQVAWVHPNPDESMVPLLAERGSRRVAAALVHSSEGVFGIHAVATLPEARGQGVATALVGAALDDVIPEGAPVAMHSDSARLTRHLERLDFEVAETSRVYELPEGAELALPRVPPATKPLWRPPRERPA